MLVEVNPLRQNNAERVVDPPASVCGLTIRNDVAHYRFYRLEHFDIQAASGFPRPAFAPVQLAINVCEFIPAPPIRENLPGKLPAGLGGHTILKSKHDLGPQSQPTAFPAAPDHHPGCTVSTTILELQ